MPAQLALPGFEVAPRPTDRLFFAIYPDAPTATRIAELARQLREANGLRGRPLAKPRFHVTLHFLGDHFGLPESLVTAATEAAASVVMPPFQVAFDRAASFKGRPRNRPFVLLGDDGLAALAQLQRALGIALTQAGLVHAVEPRYTPHVTLLYDDRSVAEQPVEPVGWRANEFVLVHSLIGKSRHVPLARWPLRG